MGAPNYGGRDAVVIDLASRRPAAEETQELQARPRRRLPAWITATGGRAWAATWCGLCRIGRGIRALGDRWGAWVSAEGHRKERAKKSATWGIGIMVGLMMFQAAGWIVLLGVGLAAAWIAGRPTGRELPAATAPKVLPAGGRQELAASGGDPSPPGGGGNAAEGTEEAAVEAGPRRWERPRATSRTVPIGPPSISPLVGRTEPLDLWRDPVVWGIDASGGPVTSILPGQPGLLIGGVSGSGKSVAAHNLLCTAALDPHARLWLVDGKRVELAYYRGIAHRYLGDPDVAAFTALVDELVAEKDRRLEAIEGRSVKITATNWQKFQMPPIILHIDEIQIYTLQGKAGQDAATQLALLASQCRAVGIFVSVATQRPIREVVPALLANNLTLKLALRCEDAGQSNTVLGDGMAGRGYRADQFTADQHGAAYYRGEVGHPVPLRTTYLHIPDEGEEGEDHVRSIVERAVELRREAGTLPDGGGRVRDSQIVFDALAVLDRLAVDRITRDALAAELGCTGEEVRDRLRAAGVRPPHAIRVDGDSSARGWYRKDLADALEEASRAVPT